MADGILGQVQQLVGQVGATIGGVASKGAAALSDGDQALGRPTIDPQAWTPPTSPGRTGAYAPNETLAAAERIPVGGHGPEDVCVGPDGAVYTGLVDGRILKFPRGSKVPIRLARVHGRPLGIEAYGDDAIVVCSEGAGLLLVNTESGRVKPLIGEYEGVGFLFANNAAVHPVSGDVYFTDSSMRFGFEHFMSDLFESSHTGRLFRYSVDAHELELLDSGLAFANGVAMGPDAAWVAYAETAGYRIKRRHLGGEKDGTTDYLVENLPGFPDNLSSGERAAIWVALVNERDSLLDGLMDKPAARHAVYLLPEAVKPGITAFGWVVGLDADGNVTHNLQDSNGAGYANVTGVREHDGGLWLGSLEEDAIARLEL